MAPTSPPSSTAGTRKKPTLPGIWVSRFPDSQSPLKMKSVLPSMKRLIIVE